MSTEIIPADSSEPLTVEILPEPTITEEFAQARIYLHTARAMASGAAALTILLGCELRRLHKKHGVRRGGDRRSDQTRINSGLKWQDLVKQELGISDDSARNYMALAEAAKSRIPEFQPIAHALLDTPLGSLPEIKRNELLEKTKELLPPTYTAQQLMWDWGVQRQPKPKGGFHPRQGPEPALEERTDGLRVLAEANFKDLIISIDAFAISKRKAGYDLLGDADRRIFENLIRDLYQTYCRK